MKARLTLPSRTVSERSVRSWEYPDPVQPATNPLRGGGLPGGLRANTGPKSCRLSVQDEGRKTVVEKRTANGSATENTTGLPQLVGVTPQTPWGEPRIGKTAALPAA